MTSSSAPDLPESKASTTHSRPQRSRADRRGRRRKVRRIVSTGALLVIAALVGLILSDTIRVPGAPRANWTRSTSPGDTPTNVDLETRPLSSTTPMRLWIAGDSLAYVLGQQLGKATGATGVVKPTYDARVSSGLTSPAFFSWPEHAKKELQRLNPESVVFVIGANDLGTVGSNDWQQQYGKRVDEMLTLLNNNDRHIYWVSSPSMRNKSQHEAARKLADFMRTKLNGVRNAEFIDAFSLFSDDKGKYQDRLPNEQGTLELVRTDDGIHFNTAGGDRLARVLYQLIERDWRLEDQAVPGVPQDTEETTGCCRTPTGSSNTQWFTGPNTTVKRSGGTSASSPTTTTTTSSTTVTTTTTTTSAATTSTTTAGTTTTRPASTSSSAVTTTSTT
ncbi:MAG: GDSL-type esterase/lipase family protein [Acidimicrobiia bacterium]